MEMRVIGADLDQHTCSLTAEILDEDGALVGIAYGSRMARLFAEASEMFDLLTRFAEGEETIDDYVYAQKLIRRVNESASLTFDGLTEQQLLKVIKNFSV